MLSFVCVDLHSLSLRLSEFKSRFTCVWYTPSVRFASATTNYRIACPGTKTVFERSFVEFFREKEVSGIDVKFTFFPIFERGKADGHFFLICGNAFKFTFAFV